MKYADFTEQFTSLRTELGRLSNLAEENARKHAANFNIFWVLGVHRREVQTHSAFLAELLDPKGAHGQGFVFLERLLQYCRRFPDFPQVTHSMLENAKWEITTEKTADGCRLDIVVECREEPRFLMVIENKVGASEQPDQIKRYGQWITEKQECPPERCALLYVTPHGDRSATAGDTKYFRISYHRDIVAWLRSAAGKDSPYLLRKLIEQYIDVIGELELGSRRRIVGNVQYERKVAEFLEKEENFETALQIRDIVESRVTDDVLKQFWGAIRDRVSDLLANIPGWELELSSDLGAYCPWAGLLVEPAGRPRGRHLRISIQQHGGGLTYGINWNLENHQNFQEISARIHDDLPDGKEGWGSSAWWLWHKLAWKTPLWGSQNLRQIRDESLTAEIARKFIELLQRTHQSVGAANMELARETDPAT
jgi:PD-(D/E)XK nuclease superfamily